MSGTPPPPRPAIEFDGATVRFPDGEDAVADLRFDVETGETLVLLGRSGAGKTTTLRLVNALLLPAEGTVRVEGRSTREWDPIRLRRRIGYVLQEGGLFPHYTVEANVGIVPSIEGWPRERTRRRVGELLDLVGLDPGRYARRYPRELSGGERQRVGVARALAADPPFLLMDEPFGALDPATRRENQRQFLRIQSALGKTVLLVTHDPGEALRLATRVALLARGRLALLVPVEAFRRSDHPEARAFLEALEP